MHATCMYTLIIHTGVHTYCILTFFFISVAITSCASGFTTYNSGEIIKFSVVKLSNGIENVDNFKSLGTFSCENPGLHFVGLNIVSSSTYAHIYIEKNDRLVSRVYVTPSLKFTGDTFHTGTGIIAVELNANDILNIKADSTMQVYGSDYSCLAVIKVK